MSDPKSRAERLPYLGFTNRNTVKLDFDKSPLKTVKYWAKRTNRFFHLEGFKLLKSSEDSYHVVFNRPVNWSKNVHIMSWVSRLSKIESLRNYVDMQGIKESSTLRVGPKGEKQRPIIIYCEGKQDGQIKKYLHERREINKIMKSLRICPLLQFYFNNDLEFDSYPSLVLSSSLARAQIIF